MAHYNVLCNARIFLLSMGFTLAFGSLFAKTYRVHRVRSQHFKHSLTHCASVCQIFNQPKLFKVHGLHDSFIILMVAGMLAIDFVLLVSMVCLSCV